MAHLLEVKDLVTTFRSDGKEFNAIEGVSLHVDRGEIVGIVGESGSGKSVTMLSVLQLISSPGRVAGGDVRLEGVDNNLLSYDAESEMMRQVRGGRISMIFQEPMTSLNPVLTVGYQIQENLMLHSNMSAEEAKKRTIEAMKMVNIPDAETRYDYYPQQFSGGMRQRIMIAMGNGAEPGYSDCRRGHHRSGRDHAGTTSGNDSPHRQGDQYCGYHGHAQPWSGGPLCGAHLRHVRRSHHGDLQC